jgi:rod shape-determining protein MreC
MDSFLSRNRNALVLIFVLLAQVVGLATQVRRPGQNASDKKGVLLIRAWVVGLVSPPERVLHSGGLGVRGVWTNYLDLIHVRQQNKNLQAQLDALRLEEASLAEDARQGQRLQALLGFREKYIYKTVAAQVIGTSGTEQSHVLFIDKGSKDGIAADMAVITPDGIVGKTRDVFEHTSQVLEISDATSGAGVIMTNTRIQGVLHGNSWGQPQIVNLSPDDRIKAGEPVVTSGEDSIYPRGLPVGTVEKITPDPEGTLVNVLVKPAANLERLEEVLVITNAGDQMPTGMQQDVSDSQQRASEILAERLPSRADPNAPSGAPGQPGTGQTGASQTGTEQAGGAAQSPAKLDNGLPTPPPKPPLPIRADRYSSASVAPAEDMVPGKVAGSAVTAPSPDDAAPTTAVPEKKKPVTPAPGSPAQKPAPKKPVVPATVPPASEPQQAPPPATPPATTTPQGRD